jgi:hypothetical protein
MALFKKLLLMFKVSAKFVVIAFFRNCVAQQLRLFFLVFFLQMRHVSSCDILVLIATQTQPLLVSELDTASAECRRRIGGVSTTYLQLVVDVSDLFYCLIINVTHT